MSSMSPTENNSDKQSAGKTTKKDKLEINDDDSDIDRNHGDDTTDSSSQTNVDYRALHVKYIQY